MPDPTHTQKNQKIKVIPSDVVRSFWFGGKNFWPLLILTFGCLTLTAVIQVTIPLFYKHFFDILASNPASRGNAAMTLITTLLEILGLNAVIWFGNRIAAFSDNYFQSKTATILRQQAFNYLIEHSYTFFSNSFSGSLVQRVNRYVRAFGRLMDQITWTIWPLFINITGIIIVLARIKPIISLIIFAWIVIFFIFNFFFSRFKSKYDVRSAETDSRVTAYLSDVITNHNVVQLFNGSKDESGGFAQATKAQETASIFAWNLAAIIDSVQSGLVLLVEFFIFFIAIHYWQVGSFTVGTFVLIQSYIIGLGGRLWNFSWILRGIYEGYADSKEMVETLKMPHDISDAPNATNLHITQGEIEFHDVVFSYNQTRTVLDRIQIKIHGKEKVALIGPSGAGKSTVIRLMLRLYDVTSGVIEIDKQNIQNITLESLRKNISLVPQDPILFHRSLKENIRYGRREATDAEVLQAAKLAHCDEFTRDLPLGYDTLVGERGIKLSGGERQRVAIARAILKNAPILILDEATSSLDSESERLIQDALDTLMRDKTVIVIAHRLSTIRKMDRIIVLDHGKITEEGTHEKLLSKETSLYKKLWNFQAGGFLKDEDAEEREAVNED